MVQWVIQRLVTDGLSKSPNSIPTLEICHLTTETDFIFLGSKITADGDCGHEMKTGLLLGRRAMKNLDSVLKSRDITLPTKLHLVKVTVFPIVMVGYESWTIKKAKCRRIDAPQLRCCWESLGQQGGQTSQSWRKSMLNIHWKDWCWSWSSNILATWFEEPTHWKRPWCWERLKAGGEGADRGWDGWMASLTQWTWGWANSGRQWRTGKPGVLQSVHRFAKTRTWFSDWTPMVDVSLLLSARLGGFSDVALHTKTFLCPERSPSPRFSGPFSSSPYSPSRTSPGNPSFIPLSDSYSPYMFPLEALPIYILSV